MSALSPSRRMGKRQEASVDPAWRVFLSIANRVGNLLPTRRLFQSAFFLGS